ncbi:MAG: hgcB [Deltaproteobacteria bacterium]|jgi:ferredoxin|nr:hgcB [Deltaproteobacteria bacterium]MBS1243772.1 hgcB [Deltaproteobacteria bacterium]
MDRFRYFDGVATVRLADAACTGCGMCEEVCPHGVFAVRERKARFLDRDACMECGACAMNCPVKAISVHPGVGCAAAILNGWLSGSKPSCGCGG